MGDAEAQAAGDAPAAVDEPPAKRQRAAPPVYIVVVAGVEFRLSREMLDADAPSFLTSAFDVRLI